MHGTHCYNEFSMLICGWPEYHQDPHEFCEHRPIPEEVIAKAEDGHSAATEQAWEDTFDLGGEA